MNNEIIKIEYLLSFNKKDAICRDKKSFMSLIDSNSDFEIIKDNILKFNKTDYTLDISAKENDELVTFHITIKCPDDNLEIFRKMSELLENTIDPQGNKLLKIWDDMSFDWSKELYEKIYNVENLLRKIINKFILSSVGIEKFNSVISDKAITYAKKINENLEEKQQEILYYTNFDSLTKLVLFYEYPNEDISKLSKTIDKGANLNDIKKNFIPQNNWDRYFRDFFGKTKVDSNKLKTDWEELYKIRNKVAHNNFLKYEEFKKGDKLCKDLGAVLKKAYENMDKINLSKEERDLIQLNINTLDIMDNIAPSLKNAFKQMESLNWHSTLENLNKNFPTSSILNNLEQLKNSSQFNFLLNASSQKNDKSTPSN